MLLYGLLLALWLTLGSGCRSTDKIEQPFVRVLGMAVVGHTPDGVRLELTLLVENPNFVPLPLIGCNYNVTIDGVGQSAFADHPHRTVPAGLETGGNRFGKQTLRLPVTIGYHGTSLKGTAYRVNGTVVYDPPGQIDKILAESHLKRPQISFRGAGRIQ